MPIAATIRPPRMPRVNDAPVAAAVASAQAAWGTWLALTINGWDERARAVASRTRYSQKTSEKAPNSLGLADRATSIPRAKLVALDTTWSAIAHVARAARARLDPLTLR
jgi:hypothetical protein